MQNGEKSRDSVRKWGIKLLLVLFDIFSVNFAYYMALVLRFYVNHAFHEVSMKYFARFSEFAPYYTICCIAVFWLMKLYSGIWRYAGLNDLNRVALANFATCAIHVGGTLLFIGRMPVTYYIIGFGIQFILICASRFSYRVLALEFFKFAKSRNSAAVNMMIVGVGETARIYLNQIESDEENLANPVCVADWRNQMTDGRMNGLPVVGSADGMREAIGKYGVKIVVIADSLMPQDTRSSVRELCKELNVSVQDFSGYTQNEAGGIALNRLMEVASGPVEIQFNGESREYENGEQAVMDLPGRFVVKSLSAVDGILRAVIEQDVTSVSSATEAWARKYEAETGEPVSFF